jgi:hypothetical protein
LEVYTLDQQILSKSLKYALEAAHTEEGWILPVRDALKEVDTEMARWKPAPEVASIWEIVAHAAPYTEGRACDFTGEPYPEDPDWPTVTDTSEAAWNELKTRYDSAIVKLHSAIAAGTDEQLAKTAPGKESPPAMRVLDIAIHDAYHAGQIVKLTQLYQASHVPVNA